MRISFQLHLECSMFLDTTNLQKYLRRLCWFLFYFFLHIRFIPGSKFCLGMKNYKASKEYYFQRSSKNVIDAAWNLASKPSNCETHTEETYFDEYKTPYKCFERVSLSFQYLQQHQN